MLPKFQIQSLFLFTVLCVVCSLPAFAQPDNQVEDEGSRIYKEAMSLLYSGQPEQAKSLLQADLDKTGSELALFGLGWLHYYHREHTKAEKTFQFILNGVPSPSRKAACQQVLGWIYLKTGRYDKAEAYFKDALTGFQDLEKPNEQMKVQLALAELNFTLNRPEKLDELFHQCIQLSHNQPYPINLGFLFSLKARREFLRSNYQGALYFSRESLAEYRKLKKHEAGTAGALADVAFFLILNGDIEAGEEANKEAVAIFERLKLETHVQWTYLNTILLKKCRSQSFQEEQDQMIATIEKHGDQVLKEGLDFVLSWNCSD